MKKIKTRKPKEKMVEVARSFSFKRNLGDYQMADYFCSVKKEVKESEMEATSEALYNFCRAEVIKSVNAGKNEKKHEIAKEIVKAASDITQGRSAAEQKDMREEVREGEMMATGNGAFGQN